jgi:maltose-binding protein MalE
MITVFHWWYTINSIAISTAIERARIGIFWKGWKAGVVVLGGWDIEALVAT